MSKLVVGMVALVIVSACGKKDEIKAKTSPAQTADAPVQKILKTVDESQPAAVETAPKAPRYTLELGEGKSGFKFRSATLSEEAKAKVDEMFTGGTFDLKDAHFEIEGYTDNLGSEELNHQVGLARAEAVRQYLGEYHEIPGDCISVVSYGMEKPVADNATPEGRARNRRVVIKVVD